MPEDKNLSKFRVDTVSLRTPRKDVRENLESLKDTIYRNIENAFPELPDTSKKNWNNGKLSKYAKDYPQSEVFVPQKELHLLPVVIEQYKRFSNNFSNAELNNNYLDIIQKHEMEHIKAIWGVNNSDFDGVGIVTLRRGENPVFFAHIKGFKEKSKLDKLKVLLASSSRYDDDIECAIMVLTKDTSIKELVSDLQDRDILYLVSTQLLPKAAEVYGRRTINKILDEVSNESLLNKLDKLMGRDNLDKKST